MAWNDTKITGGGLTADEWNAHVADQESNLQNVSEDTTPQLGGNLDLNGKGVTEEFTAASSLVSGDLCYLNGDGKFAKARADAAANCDTLLALCLDTISADATGTFLILGKYTTSGLTAGDVYYVSTSSGSFTNTAPSTSGEFVRIIGYALSTTELYFKPGDTYIEVV